jgi:hypothetical protein
MTVTDLIALVSAIITLLGVGVAVLSLRDVKRQVVILNRLLVMQHFSDYTARYQGIVLRFPEDVNEPTFKLGPERGDYRETMRAMRAYFDLCFEEWTLHQRGLIDDWIWKIWGDGMKSAFAKAAFRQAWKMIRVDTAFGAEFEHFVDEALGVVKNLSAARDRASA